MSTIDGKFEAFPQHILFTFLFNALERLASYYECQDVDARRRLDRVMNKDLFLQTILDKLFGRKKEN